MADRCPSMTDGIVMRFAATNEPEALQLLEEFIHFFSTLEEQLVVKHEAPDDVYTRSQRYYYQNNEIQTQSDELPSSQQADILREHGHRSIVSGPALQPRHVSRQHLERDGAVERADFDPEIEGDPHVINSRDTLGDTPDMMVTGVERAAHRERNGALDGDPAHPDKLVVVTYEGDHDPMDPHNWSFWRRIGCTFLVAMAAFTALWSSTIDTAALTTLRTIFSVSFTKESIPTGLFLVGFGVGGPLTGPISEVVGRNAVYISSLIIFALFNVGAGLVRNHLWERMVCRCFTGFFAAPLAVTPAGSLIDLWSRIERVYAFALYAIIAFLGPLVAPTPGAFINRAKSVSWPWVDYVTCMLTAIVLILIVLFLPETYSPLLLLWKAKQLRRLTGDNRYRAPLEFRKVSFVKRIGHSLYRPFLLFITEPIIMVFAVYLSVIFIILYTFLAGYYFIYTQGHNFHRGKSGLAFLPLVVGVLLASFLVPLAMYCVRKDILRARSRGLPRPEPEISLYMAMFASPAIPVSLFWMAWTARPSISPWSPLAASILFGFGVVCVFISSHQYIADSFEYHAASALATIHIFPSVASGGMLIASHAFYKNLGIGWALTILALIMTVFLPVPYVLYYYGHVVRRWSRKSASS